MNFYTKCYLKKKIIEIYKSIIFFNYIQLHLITFNYLIKFNTTRRSSCEPCGDDKHDERQ